MMNRRDLHRLALTGLMLLPGIPLGMAAERVTPLGEQLKNGLRATRPEQLEFIRRVVELVGANALQLRTVNAAFQWARDRRPDYPFPYFERALRVLASREGVTI